MGAPVAGQERWVERTAVRRVPSAVLRDDVEGKGRPAQPALYRRGPDFVGVRVSESHVHLPGIGADDREQLQRSAAGRAGADAMAQRGEAVSSGDVRVLNGLIPNDLSRWSGEVGAKRRV